MWFLSQLQPSMLHARKKITTFSKSFFSGSVRRSIFSFFIFRWSMLVLSLYWTDTWCSPWWLHVVASLLCIPGSSAGHIYLLQCCGQVPPPPLSHWEYGHQPWYWNLYRQWTNLVLSKSLRYRSPSWRYAHNSGFQVFFWILSSGTVQHWMADRWLQRVIHLVTSGTGLSNARAVLSGFCLFLATEGGTFWWLS